MKHFPQTLSGALSTCLLKAAAYLSIGKNQAKAIEKNSFFSIFFTNFEQTGFDWCGHVCIPCVSKNILSNFLFYNFISLSFMLNTEPNKHDLLSENCNQRVQGSIFCKKIWRISKKISFFWKLSKFFFDWLCNTCNTNVWRSFERWTILPENFSEILCFPPSSALRGNFFASAVKSAFQVYRIIFWVKQSFPEASKLFPTLNKQSPTVVVASAFFISICNFWANNFGKTLTFTFFRRVTGNCFACLLKTAIYVSRGIFFRKINKNLKKLYYLERSKNIWMVLLFLHSTTLEKHSEWSNNLLEEIQELKVFQHLWVKAFLLVLSKLHLTCAERQFDWRICSQNVQENYIFSGSWRKKMTVVGLSESYAQQRKNLGDCFWNTSRKSFWVISFGRVCCKLQRKCPDEPL